MKISYWDFFTGFLLIFFCVKVCLGVILALVIDFFMGSWKSTEFLFISSSGVVRF